jgi:hypothetical protein
MTPRTSPHKAYNTLPHSVVGLYAVEPMHIFGLFLTPELLRTIKDNTNAYERTKSTESTGRVWKELTLDELRIWLGIVIYMGVHSSPTVADYWANDNLTLSHLTRTDMSQTRLEQLKQYPRIS